VGIWRVRDWRDGHRHASPCGSRPFSVRTGSGYARIARASCNDRLGPIRNIEIGTPLLFPRIGKAPPLGDATA